MRTDTRSPSTVAVGRPDASGTRKGRAQRLRLIGKVVTSGQGYPAGAGLSSIEGDQRRAARCASGTGGIVA